MEIFNLQNINPVTILLCCILVLPLAAGLFMRFSRDGIEKGLFVFLDNLVFICCIILSGFLIRRIFFEQQGDVFASIYELIPVHIQVLLYGQDVIIYLVAGVFLVILLFTVLWSFLRTYFSGLVNKSADLLYGSISRGGTLAQSFTGIIVQLPRAAFSLFITALALNFLVYCFPLPALSQSMQHSAIYQIVYQEALCPMLNSNLAKEIPTIVYNSYVSSSLEGVSGSLTAKSCPRGKTIECFNGVSLENAVQSNSSIDLTAIELVAETGFDREKAFLIYRWIADNVFYDYEKALYLCSDCDGIESGSIIAFTSGKGVCFDYSCLYISMCRAVGLPVRLITGEAYSGVAWDDHAWNQVYLSEENTWVNVDTTFGSCGKYFDKGDFIADHRNGEIQGEW